MLLLMLPGEGLRDADLQMGSDVGIMCACLRHQLKAGNLSDSCGVVGCDKVTTTVGGRVPLLWIEPFKLGSSFLNRGLGL